MADESTTEGQAAGGTSGGEGKTPNPEKPGEKTDLATLPADVQELIRNLRAEAKTHREAKEAAELKVTELTEEVETAQTASRTMSENAEKYQRALTVRDLREEFGLDQKAEKFLTGSTDEELREQAEALSTFATPPKTTTTDDTKPPEGMTRVTDPAQAAEATKDPDAERVEAFFSGLG